MGKVTLPDQNPVRQFHVRNPALMNWVISSSVQKAAGPRSARTVAINWVSVTVLYAATQYPAQINPIVSVIVSGPVMVNDDEDVLTTFKRLLVAVVWLVSVQR